MDFNTTIAIIGGGNIGMSIAQGLVNAGKYKPEQIIITRKKSDLPKDKREGGFFFQDDNAEAVSKARIIVLSVVPHIYKGILDGIKDSFTEKHTLITVVTGVEISNFQNAIKKASKNKKRIITRNKRKNEKNHNKLKMKKWQK